MEVDSVGVQTPHSITCCCLQAIPAAAAPAAAAPAAAAPAAAAPAAAPTDAAGVPAAAPILMLLLLHLE